MKEKHSGIRYTILATDIVVFTILDNVLNILLIKINSGHFEDFWAVPGGLINPSETVDEAAKRIFFETTHTENRYLEQLYTFGSVDRDPNGRIVSVTYFALMPDPNLKISTTNTFEKIDWFPMNDIPELAYDHNEVVQFALDRLRGKITYSNIIYGLLPDEFTLSDLQKSYEIVLDRELDKRNFRKKILSLNTLLKTGKKTIGKAHRPADIYKFAQKSPSIIQML